MQGVEPEDIYNMDETGLFYRATPQKSLAKEAVAGSKVNKERITIGLATNVTGTEKLKPIVIWKAKKPRCFGKTFDPQNYVDFYTNPKAWMNSQASFNA